MASLKTGETLFVIDLTYIASPERIDALIPAHVAFLERGYAAGHFVASGPKVPREGGVILARGETKEAIRTVIGEDPFHREDVARYEITEFLLRKTAAQD